jgi:hypothetical protein
MPQAFDRNPGSLNPNLTKKTNETMKNRMKTALNQIEINGFDDIAVKNATVNSRNGDGISAWIMIDSVMNMYYELKIPLKELSGKDNLNENIISLGFESGRMELPATGQGGGGGKPSGGMSSPGGSHGGGGQGGSMNPRNPDMQQRAASMETLTEPIKIWMKRIELN